MANHHKIIGCLIFLSTCLYGCNKLVTAPAPVSSINSANVYSNDQTTAGVLTGIYTSIIGQNNVINSPFINSTYFCSLSADELTLWNGSTDAISIGFYNNELNNYLISGIFWEPIYNIMYTANAAIEGISASNSLSPAVKEQALGEAYFMRAFSYFYLVNLYGGVPLVTTTDYQTNENIARSSASTIYNQIISDLLAAKSLLSANYVDGTLTNITTQRLRPSKWAAHALLARTYLYTQDYKDAILEADTVINNTSIFSLGQLNTAFLTTSSEAIWQLQPTSVGWNTPDAELFIIPSTGLSATWPVYLSPSLLNSFEPGDQRRQVWVDSINLSGTTYYYPYKYENNVYGAAVTEYEMVLRLAEQILIRSESEANLGDLGDASTDLNLIRARAGLSDTTIANQTTMINAILHERQVELFTEWGQRWMDLKRTNTLNSTMASPGNEYQVKVPGGTWNSDWALYPIALSELQENPSLVQNAGY